MASLSISIDIVYILDISEYVMSIETLPLPVYGNYAPQDEKLTSIDVRYE